MLIKDKAQHKIFISVVFCQKDYVSNACKNSWFGGIFFLLKQVGMNVALNERKAR